MHGTQQHDIQFQPKAISTVFYALPGSPLAFSYSLLHLSLLKMWERKRGGRQGTSHAREVGPTSDAGLSG